MKQRYTYSPRVRVMTAIGLLALGLIAWILLGGEIDAWWSYHLSGLALLALLVIPAYCPRALTIEAGEIRLHCLGFTKVFPRERYQIERLDAEVFRESARLFGSAGYFGFTGFFGLPRRGVARCYIADERQPTLRLYDPVRQRAYLVGLPPALADQLSL